MPKPLSFKELGDVLAECLAQEAVLVGVEISADKSRVTIWTTTPSIVIGRKGKVIDMLTDRLTISFGANVKIRVELAEGDIEDVTSSSTGGSTSLGSTALTVHDLNPMPRPRIPRPSGA